jgi:hypothetical protein
MIARILPGSGGAAADAADALAVAVAHAQSDRYQSEVREQPGGGCQFEPLTYLPPQLLDSSPHL